MSLPPSAKKVSADDSQELIALLKKYNAEGGASATPAKGFAATLIGIAAPLVMRSVVQAAQQYFTDGGGPLAAFFGDRRARDGDFDDEGAPPDDEAAFRDFNIPR